MAASFDECFQTFPALSPPKDFAAFWKQAVDSLKKVPVEPKGRLILKKSLVRESNTEVRFKSIEGAIVKGELTIPRRRGRVAAVISFHDYHDNRILDSDRHLGDSGIAHLRIQLRGHESGEIQPRLVEQSGLEPVTSSYPYQCFLDALRAIDYVRLQDGIDTNRIALIGKGFGGAMAIFAAALYSDRVRALAIERPGFVYLSRWLAESVSPLALEIRDMAGKSVRARNRVKKTLEYLDCLYFAHQLNLPIFVTSGLADEVNTPAPVFAFFNHLRADKTMDLFPDQERDASGVEQRKKSIDFLKGYL